MLIDAVYREIWRELQQIPLRAKTPMGKTERALFIEECVQRYGVSSTTIYRNLKRLYGGSSSKGKPSSKNWKPVICRIFELQRSLSDPAKNRWYPSDLVLRSAQEKGIIEAGKISPRHYNRLVQQFGLKKPPGFNRFQASYSNELHQFDVSTSEYLEVVKQLPNGDWALKRRLPDRRGKNRRREPQRLWVAGLVDDFSGIWVGKYYVARDESVGWMWEFLREAWHGLYILRGMPKKLYVDNGPFRKSKMTLAHLTYFSEKMEPSIELVKARSYNPRARGKIERVWRTLWQSFELAFLGINEDIPLSKLNNEYLMNFMIKYNQRRHRAGDLSRAQMYLNHLPAEVRIPPEDVERRVFEIS